MVSREIYESALDTIEDMRQIIQCLESEKEELAGDNLKLIVINQALVKQIQILQGNGKN